MGRFIDLTGQKFGRLTVIKKVGIDKYGKSIWLCKCDCGNEKEVKSDNLRRGVTKSCGCYNIDMLKRRDKTQISNLNKKHGKYKTRLYRIWQAMKERCYNPNRWNYDKYGGKGIVVCDEWRNDFMNFYNWAMANGYNDNLSIDRIDNNGNYEPSNCRWTDCCMQGYNRGVQSNSTTGYEGISKLKDGRYRAYIKKNNKQISLGVHETLEAAIQARREAEKKYFG